MNEWSEWVMAAHAVSPKTSQWRLKSILWVSDSRTANHNNYLVGFLSSVGRRLIKIAISILNWHSYSFKIHAALSLIKPVQLSLVSNWSVCTHLEKYLTRISFSYSNVIQSNLWNYFVLCEFWSMNILKYDQKKIQTPRTWAGKASVPSVSVLGILLSL